MIGENEGRRMSGWWACYEFCSALDVAPYDDAQLRELYVIDVKLFVGRFAKFF